MNYEEQEQDLKAILDDSNIKETINIIKELTGKEFEVEIRTESELLDFIDNPKKYVDDPELEKEITELRDLIIQMGDFYYAR